MIDRLLLWAGGTIIVLFIGYILVYLLNNVIVGIVLWAILLLVVGFLIRVAGRHKATLR